MNPTPRIYDGYLLCGDTHAVASMGIDVRGNPDSELVAERLALSLDDRIPRNAIGYVDDIVSGRGDRRFKIDRLRMLSQHVEIVLPN